ncbi:MAG: hypothetical protein JJT78_08720, partial [Leptospira sp.]|nr:hypothetical protein [Leptospira sp.]
MKKWEACRAEAERIYRSRIRDREDVDSANFPIQISLGSIRTEELLADRSIWREWEESISGSEGVHIQTVTRETRKYGTQTLPKYLVLDNWTALLSFIGKEDEYREFRELEMFTHSRIPDLKDWVRSHWEDVLEYKQDWSSIVVVVLYFIENDNSKAELHLREIPISVHT